MVNPEDLNRRNRMQENIQKEEIKELVKKEIEYKGEMCYNFLKNKEKACEKCGIKSLKYNLSENTTEEELVDLIDKLNKNKENASNIFSISAIRWVENNTKLSSS